MGNKKQSDLTVITKAKELCSYIMTVTQKSPKHFRYTFVSRLQNLTLDVIENLYMANEIFVKKGDLNFMSQRLKYQREAMTKLKLKSRRKFGDMYQEVKESDSCNRKNGCCAVGSKLDGIQISISVQSVL